MVDRLVNSEANARRIQLPLAVPGRVLVGEGVLTKMCRKRAKARQFFLFNDILVYGNILMNRKKYNKQHIIPLEAVKLESLEDDGHFKNGWVIRTSTKSFAVYAATSTEKQEWMAHINKCIEDLLRKSGKKAVEEHAAVWVPDSEAVICMHCQKSQFTVLNRRHHCRKCGAVVCNPCSNKRYLLPHQSSKPLRVCLTCYDSLTRAKVLSSNSGENSFSKDSSGEDDSDDEEDSNRSQQEAHDEHFVSWDSEEEERVAAQSREQQTTAKFYGISEHDDHK
ncbi:Pleckstrin-like proteiny domain-containing family F member 1-like protein [Frankliniella fusca]|uniref:Pleckstrin-like proteiny domain-containing family F member 1-like protein n=1 Tax=Frankliniella fusca TaxID=407009 RepID=A0AAE1LPW0_9NEOP|nr:Pleckstrin-like proteiny domain-containing family F member 1-like protein [Frankliniella fusca]